MGFLSDNFISQFFVTIINWFYSWTGNYLIAVVLFTVLIKVLLMPLDIRSKRQQRKQQRIGPKVQAIQERYKHDQRLMSMKLQELYKKEDVKMTAGCLPTLLQMPVLFAMFGAIRAIADIQTVEMVVGMAADPTMMPPSFFWVKNIWQPDTGTAAVLPTLASYTQLVGTTASKLSPEMLQSATVLVQNANLLSLHDVYTALPADGFFAAMYQPAFNAITPEMLSAAQTFNFNAALQPAIERFGPDARNGLFIMPILAGLSMYASTKLVTSKQLAQNPAQQQSAGSNMMMEILMPVLIAYFASTTAMAFALYWVVTNLWTIVSNMFIDLIHKHDEKKLEEQEFGD
ncbi:YidC/Oxa1 family membrane protein insertase [Eubacteriales bacterium OttesenSCG-928-N14]|nr:YidC/Oxa1 family membrane protein insertase [Eubacteriales bacterium OttesenSCG-928-N14]